MTESISTCFCCIFMERGATGGTKQAYSAFTTVISEGKFAAVQHVT